MTSVSASISIPLPPEHVWKVAMDPCRLGDWVTVHRRLIRADTGAPKVGFEMDQQIHLRGVSVDVHWRLIECLPGRLAVWEGRGPARSRARTEYRLTEEDAGSTQFDYRNEFRVPLGPLGALASRALIGGMPEREALRTLSRLRSLLTS